MGVITGVGTALGSSITALANETATTGTAEEAVQAAKTLMGEVTTVLNITNVVAILSAGIGSCLGLWLAWWGARKLVKMVVNVFRKGKITL